MNAESTTAEVSSDETPVGRISGLVRLLLITFILLALVLNMNKVGLINYVICLLYTSPSPRDS